MTANLQKLHVPLLLRVVLLELAERRGQTEEQVLESLIRDAVKRELLAETVYQGGNHEPEKK